MSQALSHFEVLDFKLGSTVGGTKQYARTLAIHANEGQLNDLMRNTNNGASINANTLTASSSIIGMSTDARSALSIEGGWDAPRAVFFIKARNNATGDVYMLQGYTTTDFMSPGGGINNHAMLSFNSFSEFTAYTNHEGRRCLRPATTDSLLVKQRLSNSNYPTAVYERPTDVLSSTACAELGGGVNSISVNQSFGCSTARNAQAGAWFGQSLLALSDAATSNSMDHVGGGFNGGTLSGDASAAAMLSENVATQQPLLGTIISGLQGSSSMEVSWTELISHLPGLRNFLTNRPVDAGGVTHGDFEPWNGRDSAQVFSELASSVPALMMTQGISSIRFRMSNEHGFQDPAHGSRPIYTVLGSHETHSFGGGNAKPSVSFIDSDLDHVTALRTFESRMCNDLFPRISNGHKVTITIDASMVTHMIMTVSYDGYECTFPSPTFAHARWSLLTANAEEHTNLVNNLYKVADHLANTVQGISGGFAPTLNQADTGSFGQPSTSFGAAPSTTGGFNSSFGSTNNAHSGF